MTLFRKHTQADEHTPTPAPLVPGFDGHDEGSTAQSATAFQSRPATAADSDSDAIDDDLTPQARQKMGAVTGLLATCLVIALGFLAGSYVQKHYGKSSGSTRTAAGGGAAAYRAGGAGYGGANAGTGQFSAPTAGAQAAAPVAAVPLPVLIGTVVSVRATSATVKNLGGKTVSVRLGANTTITVTLKAGKLKAGQSVSVFGRSSANGSVTATAVTVR